MRAIVSCVCVCARAGRPPTRLFLCSFMHDEVVTDDLPLPPPPPCSNEVAILVAGIMLTLATGVASFYAKHLFNKQLKRQ